MDDCIIPTRTVGIIDLKFSSKSHYGLRAMIALARSYDAGPVPLAEIARVEDISLSYLEQLISCLRKAGLVESTRGAHGGYRLAAAPHQMTAGQVLRTLEGPIAPAECASEQAASSCCIREADCPSKILWKRVRDNIAQAIDTTTLADLSSESEINVS